MILHLTKTLIATVSLMMFAIIILIQPAFAASNTSQFAIDKKIDAAANAYQAGRYDDAAKLFREVVQLDSRHALAWYFLGRSLTKAGDFEGSRKPYKKALEIQPTGKIAENARKVLAEFPSSNENVYVIQVDAFSNQSDAESLKTRLARIGLDATIVLATIQGKGIWYRVRIGPYYNQNDINRVRATLSNNGMNGTLVRVN